jgi:hypothetical protein
MPTPHLIPSGTIEPDRIEGLALDLQRYVTGIRTALALEIRSYPTPIPRCDAQFNYLVEQRDSLSRLLTDLDIALGRHDGGAALRIALKKLRDRLPCGDSEEERHLRDRIDREFDACDRR